MALSAFNYGIMLSFSTEVGSATAVSEKKNGSPSPETEEKMEVQLEPSQEEMERERLTSKAEQVKLIKKPLTLAS